MRRLRKFPKELKALPLCQVLEERMREFKDSIPLFADLKNDALRERYSAINMCMYCMQVHVLSTYHLHIA